MTNREAANRSKGQFGKAPEPYTIKPKHLKYLWSETPVIYIYVVFCEEYCWSCYASLKRLDVDCVFRPQDPVQPTVEQLKQIAMSTAAYIDPNQLNLYEMLKSKFPGKDVENDPNAREQYLYYLKVCGGYYADKNAAQMDRLAEKNARQQQRVIDRLWQTLRVRQMANNDSGSTDDDSDSDAAASASAADDLVPEGTFVEPASKTASFLLPDSEPVSASDSERTLSTPDLLTLSGDEELTDNGDHVMVLSEERFPGDSAAESQSQSQPYNDVDMVPNATSTQTQK